MQLRPPWSRRVAATLATAGIAVVFAVLATSCDSDSRPAATETPTAGTATPGASGTASPSATATASATVSSTPGGALAINGVPVVTLNPDKNEPMPRGALFYVVGGCSFCDGAATSVDRVYIDQAGQFHADHIFERSDPEHGEYITSVATSADGHHLMVGVCRAGAYCGGVGEINPKAKVTFYQSDDGGISWTTGLTVDGGAWVLMSNGPAASLIWRIYRPSPDKDWVYEYVYLAGGRLEPPAGGPVDAKTTSPLIFGYGVDLIARPKGLYRLNGASNPDLAPELPPGATVVSAQPGPSGGFVVVWRQDDTNRAVPAGTYAGLMKQRQGAFEKIVRFPGEIAYFTWNGAAVSGQPLMNVFVPGGYVGQDHAPTGQLPVPALVDFANGRIRPIGEYFPERAAKGDRSQVIAVAQGPFVKIQGAGDCLNVRADTAVSAQSLGCFKDGVLLVDRQQTRVAGGITWVAVSTPAGAPGWASAQFLNVAGRDMSERPTGQPPGARTGNPEVDPVIAAIESNDPAAIVALTSFMSIGCVVNPQGIGAPPTCASGVAEGTLVEALPGASCEGYYSLKADYSANPYVVPTGATLWAVVKRNTPGGRPEWPQGEYVLIYAYAQPSQTFGAAVYITGGKIVNRWSGCATTPAEMLKQLGADVTVILAPRS